MGTSGDNQDDFLVPQWIKPFHEITGRDHLGIQAISISLYGQLLPGITNLTQRVRYYSIYPWFLHHYAKRIGIRKREKWIHFLRKAEFLYALSCLSENQGETGVIGHNKATKLLYKMEGKKREIRFSEYANYESPKNIRYFQNKLGGYGQYYHSALESVDILTYPEDARMEKLTPLGSKLAHAIDELVPAEITNKYFLGVEQGKIDKGDLIKFGKSVGLSKLIPHSEETELLEKRLFDGDKYLDHENTSRRETLLLLLNIADQMTGKERIDVQCVRDILYYRYLPHGKPLKIHKTLQSIADKWRCYLIGEYIHLALEVLFKGILDLLANWDKEPPGINDLVKRGTAIVLGVEGPRNLWRKRELSRRTWGELTKKLINHASSDKDWTDEMKITPRSISNEMLAETKEGTPGKAMSMAVGLVALMIGRHYSEKNMRDLYGATGIMGKYFPDFNPFLISRRIFEISGETCERVLTIILKKYIIERHFKVALTKLRYQNEGTFKLILEDGRLHWVDSIEPAHTNPRLLSALQCLRDLKLVELSPCKILPLGKRMLDELYG